MEFKLNKAQRLVTNATAKDKSRPLLNTIHIFKGFVEAANGFLTIRKHISYKGDEELLLSGEDVASCHNDREAATVQFTTEAGNIVKAKGKQTLLLKSYNGTFPNMDRLYPLTSEETLSRLAGRVPACKFKIALSRRNLLNLLSCLSEEEETIRFFFYGENSAVKFEVQDRAEGLLMPMQVQWSDK